MLDSEKKQHKVRIAGIDAPERRQPYSDAAKQNLAQLTFTRLVEARCYKRDRYGRDVCRVFIGAGQDAGLEQIRAGMAWWFREYANEQTPQEREAYQAAEEAAKAEARGLWWEGKPVPPWEWRRRIAPTGTTTLRASERLVA